MIPLALLTVALIGLAGYVLDHDEEQRVHRWLRQAEQLRRDGGERE